MREDVSVPASYPIFPGELAPKSSCATLEHFNQICSLWWKWQVGNMRLRRMVDEERNLFAKLRSCSAAALRAMADKSAVDAYCLRFTPAKRNAPSEKEGWLSLLHNALPWQKPSRSTGYIFS